MRRLKTSEIPLVKRAILEKRQNFKCVICEVPLTVLSGCLDHDHATGLVRGVLCRNCNGIEGKIKNLVTRGRRGDPHVMYLGRLLRYWMTHQKDQTGLLHPTYLDDNEKRIKRNFKARKARAKKKAEK